MSTLYPVGYFFVWAFAWALAPFFPKIRRGLVARRGLRERVRRARQTWPTRPAWFHVASSGELEQALPVMDALRLASPRTPIFLSYFSPTAERALALERDRREASGTAVPWDAADYSPFDFPWTARAFVTALDPRNFIAIHRELWPGLIAACWRRKVPCSIIAMSLPMTSPRRLRHYARLLAGFRFVGTSDQTTLEKLAPLIPSVRVEAAGDPRVERVLSRRRLQAPPTWKDAFSDRPTLVFASLWDEDFAALHPVFRKLQREMPAVRLVLVPHEPSRTRLEKWSEWWGAEGRPLTRWSAWRERPVTPAPSLLIDGVGFLAELYQVATLVFVGGSFKGRVHNVLEPAAYGCPILTGPDIKNSTEASELATRQLGLFRFEEPEALADELVRLIANPALRSQCAENLRQYLEEKAGAAFRYLQHLRSELGESA